MLETPVYKFSWLDIGWRLLLTLLILVALTGFSLTVFNNLTTQPDARVLPTLTQETVK